MIGFIAAYRKTSEDVDRTAIPLWDWGNLWVPESIFSLELQRKLLVAGKLKGSPSSVSRGRNSVSRGSQKQIYFFMYTGVILKRWIETGAILV